MTRTTPHGRRALAAACALAVVVVLAHDAHARLGDLDPGFNGAGVVLPDVGAGASRFDAVTTRPDGRPVAAGWAVGADGAEDAVVAQQTTGGAADPLFGTGGVARPADGNFARRLHGVALDGAGRALAAGDQRPRTAPGALPVPVVLRFAADGGGTPQAFPVGADPGEARAVLPLANGGMLVAGWRTIAGAGDAFFLARLDANGALDLTFDDDGFAQAAPLGANARALAMAIDAAGRIVLAGRAGAVLQPALVRYGPGGALDATFGAGGVVTTLGTNPDGSAAGELRAVRFDGAGRIVAAGVSGRFALVARLGAAGGLDGAFGSGGTTYGPVADGAELNGLVVDGDRVLVAGAAGARIPRVIVGALGSSGAPDPGIGGAPPGWRAYELSAGQPAQALAAAPGPGGTLYAAGIAAGRGFIGRTLPNAAPAAALTGPAQVAAGVVATFDASASSDPEGEPLSYAFDLDGDGSFELERGAGATAARSLPARGTFTVGVRVTDPRGASAVATRAITVTAAPPKPVLGKRGVARTLRGKVRYRLPGKKKFVRLNGLTAIPNGTEIDATRGRVLLTVVRNAKGKLDSAQFYAGRFVFRQAKGRKPLTTLKLSGGTLRSCRTQTASLAMAAAAKGGKKRVRKLWGDGHGRFRTRGRYGAATVRGTKWLTKDRCDGTLVRVERGRVGVVDLGVQNQNRDGGGGVGGGGEGGAAPAPTKVVRAGQRTLVRAGRGG
jgi:uncharacterized delta-60 repeat protein